jgi:GT2 family glycosyltransferase
MASGQELVGLIFMNSRIAVIVPCRNRREKTLRFLKRIYQQTIYQQTTVDMDVVIVDADSTDGTVEAVAHGYPDAIVLRVGSEDYWSATTNAGVRFALVHAYDYVLTINDDSTIEPDHVSVLLNTTQQSQTKILGSRIDYLTQPGMVWSLGTSLIWGPRILQLNAHNILSTDLPKGWTENTVVPVDTMPGNGVLIHRSVFEQIGLYEDRMLPHYHGDSEFVLRAKKAGIQAWMTAQTVLYDDSPPPNVQEQEKNQTPDRFWVQDFWETFFHPRSGWYLKARVYLIWTYCPGYLKPLTLVQGTIGVMIGWLGQRAIRAMKRQLSQQIMPKVLPFLAGR